MQERNTKRSKEIREERKQKRQKFFNKQRRNEIKKKRNIFVCEHVRKTRKLKEKEENE